MLTGVIDLRSLVASKTRLNAALQRQRPSVTHDASSDDFRIADDTVSDAGLLPVFGQH